MQRETTALETGSVTFVINLDNDVAAYLNEQANGNPNQYIVNLLEKARQSPQGQGNENARLDELNAHAPGASAR